VKGSRNRSARVKSKQSRNPRLSPSRAMSGITAFLGDSITNGGRWDLLFPDARIANFGVDGECSQHVLARLLPVIAVKPARLFLMIGTNDLAWGIAEDAIVDNVAQILDRLSLALPDCRLYLQSVLPREPYYAAQVASLNRHYARLAAEKNTQWVDLVPRFDGGGGRLREELGTDGLHLSPAGYVTWREAIATEVS
jgi:lysophospholipase L1-like esterase